MIFLKQYMVLQFLTMIIYEIVLFYLAITMMFIGLMIKYSNNSNNQEKIYHSIDYAKHDGVDQADRDIDLNYPIEYLNS